MLSFAALPWRLRLTANRQGSASFFPAYNDSGTIASLNVRRIFRTGLDVMRPWVALVVRRQHLKPRPAASSDTVGETVP